MSGDEEPRFREEQRLTQWWVWAILLLIAAIGWWGFFVQIVGGKPWGSKPAPDWAVWLIFLFAGIGFPALMLLARLIVTVDSEVVRIRWIPFAWKTIRLADIESSEARDYRPLLEYGGWGIRWRPGRGMAWNAHGNRGVQLVLTSGKRVLIGSQRADELADEIERARRAATGA